MNSFYMILYIIGSFAITKRIKDLNLAIKSGDNGRIKVEWLFLGLTIILFLVLIFIKNLR